MINTNKSNKGCTKMIKATLVDVMGNDLEVVKAAKVSYDNDETVEPLGWDGNQPILTDKQKGLIKYLARGMDTKEYGKLIDSLIGCHDVDVIKDKLWQYRNTPTHAAPFGHCFLSFMVEAPVFVARHAVKSEYLRMSEISRRYIKGEPVYFKPDSWSGLADNVKQGAGGVLGDDGQDAANVEWFEAVHGAGDAYHNLLQFVAPEEARMVLPLCHMTRWRWSGSLDAFMNMLNLRLDPHTQSQTRLLAGLIADSVKKAFPVSYAAYVDGDV
jgi:thymidylate synthase (FAD)